MSSKNNNDGVVSLYVHEAYARDIERNIARMDEISLGKINATEGDIVEIKGKRKTVAKCLLLYPSDERREIIRIDGLGRHNSGVEIGGTIQVRKIKAVVAEKVVVAPLEAIPPIDERYLADALESVPLIKGDNVMVPYFGGRLTFQVIGITPYVDAVLVTKKTVFHVAAVSREKSSSYDDNIRQIMEDVLRLNTLNKDELDSLISFIKKVHDKNASCVLKDEISVFSEGDIDLVVHQTGVDREKARSALIESEGDLARAILLLTTK